MNKKLSTALAVAAASLVLLTTACTAETSREAQLQETSGRFDNRAAPVVTGDAEYSNYVRAQEDVYDDPNTILWCSSSFPTATSPIFTVPIAGKLTSSSVSMFPGESVGGGSSSGYYKEENVSVDGMYHGSPGPYRYGFTPGGVYVDFTNLSVFCSTSLVEFQRQALNITASESQVEATQTQAEDLLRAGDQAGAQNLLDGLEN